MYEPNYDKIKAQQDAEASIMAANLFQLVKEQTRAEIVERRKDKVNQIGDDIVETIKACFWRGFYNGTQDAKTDISNLAKQKGKKADLASTFSFSNFMTNVIEFESEEEKLRREISEIEKKLGQFRGLSGKAETPLQKQLREKKEQLAQITPVKLIDTYTRNQDDINKLKEEINDILKNQPGYAKNIPYKQDEIKRLQRSNAKIRKEVPDIGELAAKRLVEKATATETPEEAPKKKSKGRRSKNTLLSDVPDVKPSKPKAERQPTKDDPRVKEIINSPELKAILAKSENDRSRAEQAKLNNAEAELSAIYGRPVSFRGNETTPKSNSSSGNRQVRKNPYQIERDRLEQGIPEVKGEVSINTPEVKRTKKLLQDLLKRNDPKDTVRINDLRKELTSKGIKISVDKFNTVTLQPPEKADQALKRSIYRMEDKRNRERFITLNTEYPSLFDNNPETNSFFQRYLNQRALTIKDGLKKSQEADIKSRVVGFASDTGVSGKGVIELIQKNLAKPEDIAKVNRLRNTVRVKRDRLRFSNAEYLERYENRVATSKTGFTKDELIYINSQRELIKLEEKEEKGGLSSEDLKKLDDQKTAAYRRIDQAEQVIDPDRFDLLDDYAFEGGKTLELDPKKLESLKEKAKNNPKGLANFDRTRRATLTPQEIQQLKATIGEKAYNWAVQKAEVGPNGELRLNSAHLLRLQEKLEQASLNNDTKLMQRATSIATTEISAAYNLGRLQVYLDNGVRYVQYTATLDNKTTVFCQSLHKKIYPLNQLLVQSFTRTFFPITEEPEYSPSNRQYAMREGITFWMPPAHINCRSFLLPIYTDDVKEKIEENELAKKYKLNVSKEIEKSSINRSLRKGKGKLRAVDDARINDIISKQSRQNEFLTRKSIREVSDFADLFADGYRFIANKLREKGTRFEDGKLILDPEDIKKNDRSLTALLLGSGMVLGFGAMLYFFSKSNLAGALSNYIATTLGKKAADATAAEVATVLGAIDSVINNIPQGLRDQLVDEATPDKPLPDLSKLPKTNDPGGDLLALAKQTQNINDYVAVLNSLSEEELVSLLGASGLTSIERRRIGVQAVVNRINQNINGNIVPQYDAIVKAALGNNKGLAGGLDLKNVRQIQNFSPDALQVKFKPGFGSPTLLSKRRLQTAVGFAGRKEILEQMRQEVNEEIELLDQWAENLKSGDDQSAIDRALIIKTRKELAEIQAGLEGFANNFEYFRNVDYDALPAETWGDVAAQFGTAARSEVERASVKLYENQIKLDNLANRLRNDFDDLREFDPDIYGKNFFENFNIDSFRQNLIREARQELDNLQLDPLANQDDINEAREYLRNVTNNTANYELPELKDLEFQIQNVINQVNKKYIGKNKPYDLKIAVRRLNDGESEYNTIKQSIDESSNVMRVYGEGENVSPVLSIINKGYADYVQSKYELMLRVQEQIRTRIKELESNNQ